jgi:hypothetical protein
MKLLVKKKVLLEKFHGKGGWTYARLPEVAQDKKQSFGWVRVSGTIDGFLIKQYNLMPMGDGRLFLPVKAEIRKKINKKEGDWVEVELYRDDAPLEVPGEFLLCLEDEPKAMKYFNSLTDAERRYYVDWVYSAKKEETKINRLAKAINKLGNRLKFHDKEAE